MADALLSAALQVLFDRLASPEIINFFRGQKLDDALFKLKTTLLAVNVVLNDAEEKQITNPLVKAWLDELKDSIYDADDLLDEIATDVSRCKLEGESHCSQVWNSISTSLKWLNPLNEGMKSKIEGILGKLEHIAKQKELLGLKEVATRKPFQKLPTTSLVDESRLYGRDDERRKIIELLLSDGENENEICVIAVVGLGGVGKTTLAQLVYNDDEVKKHFDLKPWVCVLEEFDVSRVTKAIFEAVIRKACDINDLNMLQVELKRRIMGKKFLLVLDDAWIENYIDWNAFQEPFKYGAKGSKIIVTTRNENVASITQAVSTHHLEELQDEDSWLLFAKHAFGNGDSSAHPNLEVTGREIVKKCKGLPFALKTLGGLLHLKRDIEEWNKVLMSDIWDFPQDRSNILPALSLSYHYLSPHLKRCFAYCSIFPKGYKFWKEQQDQLVLLWMAEGLLQHSGGKKRLEEVGEENFHDLVTRSFFQQSSGDESCFVMHDLINDLAQFVFGRYCFRLEGESSQGILEKTRHLSFCRGMYDASKEFEAFCGAKCLRTFLQLIPWTLYLTNNVPHDLLPKLSCLRVLSLPHSNFSELPESIGSLKHLRYVDLSWTQIGRLPNSTSTLINLQTLKLYGCYQLTELPTDMRKLINLRHLNISAMEKMPMHMSKLRSLQTLSYFVVGKDNGCLITELGELQHLRGTLCITQLQNVVHAEDALEAKLKDKEYLDELVLKWCIGAAEDSRKERDVLDKLQPHANLKRLRIDFYSGTRFPEWLGDHSFCKMVSLSFYNCKHCFSLPALGQLPCLKSLLINGFDELEKVGQGFYRNGPSANKPFGLLETLQFYDMKEWVEWYCSGDDGGEFPCLKVLHIIDCPKLNGGFPGHLPSLTDLVICNCQQLKASFMDGVGNLVLRSNNEVYCHVVQGVAECQAEMESSVETLRKSQRKELPKGETPSTTLKHPHIKDLRLFPPEEMTHNYESLYNLSIMSSCDSLKSFPLGLFPNLKRLVLKDCKNLETLWIPGEDLSSLNELCIEGCKNLKSLPERMDALLSSLRGLTILGCPQLEWFPEGDMPSNLSSLAVSDCGNFTTCLMEWGLQRLASLKNFWIGGWEQVESFPEDEWLLPSSLASLSIWSFPHLKYLTSLQHLTSLGDLMINDCPELQCLPQEGLPASLSYLSIEKSPLLEQRCQREEGEEWPKITHIRQIQVNGKWFS